VLAIAISAAIAAAGPPPDLVTRMLQRIQDDTAASRSLTYVQERTEYEVSSDTERLVKREVRSVRGTGTGFVQRLIAKDGTAVSNAKEGPLTTAIAKLAEKYVFKAIDAEPESVDGYDCWRVAFEPRSDLQDKDNEDAILNRLVGTAYIDTHNYLIRRISAKITQPFRRKIFVTFQDITVEMHQMEWDGQKHIGMQTTTVFRVR